MDLDKTYISEKEWEHLLSTLSPTKISALKKSLKTYQTKYRPNEMIINISSNKENDLCDDLNVSIKSEPVTTSRPFFKSHKTKNRGLTYENGRRNLKLEPVTGEERERRDKRRERNRVAAQKCRERRQQQIEELQQQVYILRSTEQKLNSTLKQLSDEENALLIKLSNHNCIISESNSDSISFLIQPNFNDNNLQYSDSMCCRQSKIPDSVSSYSVCRPNSLPVSCHSYHNNSVSFSKPIGQYISKEDSLTPLLSPDNYAMTTENMPATSSQSFGPNIQHSKSNEKVVFLWSNSVVEQLSMSSLGQTTNSNDLFTPIVDIPFYSAESFSHNVDHVESMNWQSRIS